MTVRPPGPDEYPPAYQGYVREAAGSDLLATLENEVRSAVPFLRDIPPGKVDHRYRPEKWSVKEVVGHVIDCERVFAYRALAIARGDTTPQPGFDEGEYARTCGAGARDLNDLIMEFELVRLANLAFFRALPPQAWDRRGTANEATFSVRGLAAIIAGHGRHHMDVLRERYLA
jgi:hypothetical protein